MAGGADEVKARLDDLWDLPWAGESDQARARLVDEGKRALATPDVRRGRSTVAGGAASKSDPDIAVLRASLAATPTTGTAAANPEVEQFRFPAMTGALSRVSKLFRSHREEPITNVEELAFRNSFDEALGRLQLLELAVVTGYLPLEVVRTRAREELIVLLWPSAARQYLRIYDYLGVRFLAARVGVELGLPAVDPPAPDASAAVRYATFLSQISAWHEDPDVDEWLGFLDDYVEYEDEQADVDHFLRTGLLPDKSNLATAARFQRLAIGAERVLALLADLHNVLEPRERPLFGVYHAYWMAKLFGYKFDERRGRFVYDSDRNWSACLKGRALETVTVPRPVRMSRRKELAAHRADAGALWKETKALLERHVGSTSGGRPTSAPPPSAPNQPWNKPMPRNGRTVSQRRDGSWANKKDGAERASSLHDTQAAAARTARQQLRSEGGGELRVKGEDGKIRTKDTIRPAKDPYPPKG